MKNDIAFETNRLVLRVPTLDDAAEINRAMNEVWHELQLWMSWAYDGENTLDKTRAYIEESPKAGNIPLVGFCRDTGRYVISTGLMGKGDDTYETGYWVAKDFLGKGYATEATEGTLDFAFTKLNAKEVGIGFFEGNDKSRRIIEKLGFEKTGVLEKSHARCLNGELLDEHKFRMTQEQWRLRCR